MKIEVVYAKSKEVFVKKLDLAEQCCVQDALDQAGIVERFPDIDLYVNKVGIYGRIVRLDTLLKEHDRVEVYRPLKTSGKKRQAGG